MANTQGVAYVFGSPATIELYSSTNITTSIFTGSLTSTANEGFDLSHECDTEEVKNTSGEVVGHIVSNNRLSLNVNCIPSGATAANALITAFLADGNGTAVIAGAKEEISEENGEDIIASDAGENKISDDKRVKDEEEQAES